MPHPRGALECGAGAREVIERLKTEHAAELTKREEQHEAVRLTAASLREELEAARTRIGESETSWRAMRDEVRRLDEQLSASESEAASAKATVAELRSSLRDALAEAAAASERADEASARATAAEEQLETVRPELAALKAAHADRSNGSSSSRKSSKRRGRKRHEHAIAWPRWRRTSSRRAASSLRSNRSTARRWTGSTC